MKKYTIDVTRVSPEDTLPNTKFTAYSLEQGLRSTKYYPLAFVQTVQDTLNYKKEIIINQAILNNNILDKIDKLIKYDIPPVVSNKEPGESLHIYTPEIPAEPGTNFFLVYLALD